MKLDVLSEYKKKKKKTFAQIFILIFFIMHSCLCTHVLIFKHECAFCSKRLVCCPSKLGFISFPSCHSLVLWFMFRSVTRPHWVA